MQNGAVEAYWAHNPEVRGSKPRSAIFVSFFLQSEAFIVILSIVSIAQNIFCLVIAFIKMLWFLKEPLVFDS